MSRFKTYGQQDRVERRRKHKHQERKAKRQAQLVEQEQEKFFDILFRTALGTPRTQ